MADVQQLDGVYQSVTASIEYAEAAMSKTRTSVEKARVSKENRNKVVSKASEIVNALLEPAFQVANLLDGIGVFFPPCAAAGAVLAALVKLESDRRDSDVRVALLFLDFATALANLGTLKPGFQTTTTLASPLEGLLQRFKTLMEEFGQFCEGYYESKALTSKLKHLLHSQSNKDSLQGFADRLVALKNDLISLLSHQAVLVLSTHTEALRRIEARLDTSHKFYATVSDGAEDSASAFVSSHGGEEAVRKNDRLLEQLASTVGEKLTPSILRVVKEGAEESFKQSYASFMLKYRFALEQRISESQEAILNELKSGPYELIHDPEVKEIWKNTASKESSVKRRQLIDGINYHFNIQFKTYKAEHHRAEREDAWTKVIISKVQFHPAIGDAIDDDASGYVSIEEVNVFMRRKPEKWTVPQWVAYWAYGWDADNELYKVRILKFYTQLEKLRDGGGPRADLIGSYLSATEERIKDFINSLYPIRELDPSEEMKMGRLREELRTRNENEIKTRLKSVNFRIDYSVLAAVTGSDRVEATFYPLASVLISRHLWLMSKPDVSQEVVEEAISSVTALKDAMEERIHDLKKIWRRQRMDVDTQIRYYANGLLQNYYRKYRKEEFDSDVEDLEESEWDSEDEWSSEEGDEGGHTADNADTTDTSGVAQQNQPATSASIPVVNPNSAPQQRGLPRETGYNRSLDHDQDQSYPGNATYHGVQGHGGYNVNPNSAPQQRGLPRETGYNQQRSLDHGQDQSYPGNATYYGVQGHVGNRDVGHNVNPNSAPQQRGLPRETGYNRQRSLDHGQDQSYPGNATYYGVQGHGGHRDVGYNYEDGEGEAVDEFDGGADQPEGYDDETQEHEPVPGASDEEQDYPVGEPLEGGEDEQGYDGQDDENYGAGRGVERGEYGNDEGYGYRPQGQWGR